MTEPQRRQMTNYISLLFSRSMARRKASKHVIQLRDYALQQFLANEVQLITVATHWNLDVYFRRVRLGRLITVEDVVRTARKHIASSTARSNEQESYAKSVAHAMTEFDQKIFYGKWRLVGTTADAPFILSDAPVVTWERLDNGEFNYGVGSHRANTEIVLPMSPQTCLHILPSVERTRPTRTPLTQEINVAQAAFASISCFSDRYSDEINNLVQKHISTIKLGENAFTAWHKRHENTVYEILMGRPSGIG